MRAVDTNVVVRCLTGDDPDQAAKAKSAIGKGNIFVSTTVLLETERVLRGAYGFDRKETVAALRAFVGLPGVSMESPALIVEALDRTENGMDFTDALHLGAAASCKVMLTFDRQFIRMAKGASTRVAEPEDHRCPGAREGSERRDSRTRSGAARRFRARSVAPVAPVPVLVALDGTGSRGHKDGPGCSAVW